MPEPSPQTPDLTGPTRTSDGTILDQNQSLTSTPASESTKEAKTATTTTPPSPDQKTPEKTSETDGKAAGDKSLLGQKSPEEKGAPDSYSDFKVPEGYTLDAEVAKEVGSTFKNLDLSQAQAQTLVDLYVKYTTEAFNAQPEHYANTRKQWRDEISSSPDLGGTKLNGALQSIGKLLDSVGDSKLTDSFKEAMDYTGAGDHPAVVRVLNFFAAKLNEGTAVRGNGPSTDGQRAPGQNTPSAAQAMYPHLPSNRG